MLTGLNHLTLAVQDLSRSVNFYQQALGFKLRARWKGGAYLELGDLWLCLSLDESTPSEPAPHDTHYAFSVAQHDFSDAVARLQAQGVRSRKENRSEGDSFYFLDPDGHKLELHVGDLSSRLAQCRRQPYQDMTFFD